MSSSDAMGVQLCQFCNPNSRLYKSFQQDPVEMKTARFLANNLPGNVIPAENIPTYNDCGVKKRPDILYISGSLLTIIEVDEKRHSSYNQSCERSRMVEIISAALTDTDIKHVRMIRFNPDSCKDWPSKKYPLESRLQQLLDTVKNDEYDKDSQYHFTILYQY